MSSLESQVFAAAGPLLGGRVYPGVAPQDVDRPYATVNPVSTSGSYTLARVGNNDRRALQIDVYTDESAGFEAHAQLAKAVRFALEGAGGRMGNAAFAREDGTRLYRTRLDISFWHRPA